MGRRGGQGGRGVFSGRSAVPMGWSPKRRRDPTVLGAALLLMAFPVDADGQEWVPTRVDEPPVIDGVLDEPFWRSVTAAEGFRTYEPDYGGEMLGDTRVLMAYDDDNLYFGFLATDPDPGLIRASVTSRDNMFQDDWVAINLDSFGDAQSLYAFYVNPLGIQGDSRLAAGNEDRGVDLVWYSAGAIDDGGYTVEVRIPLQSIRFTEADPVRMGVIFERRISRNSEWGTVPELDPARAGQWENQMYPLAYAGMEMPGVIEILPAVTYAVDQADFEGRLHTQSDRTEVSLTTKLGLSSDLVLDGTLNPDFSQVEADAGQVDVNLRSAVFYPEKRPFFLEGREQLGVAATGGMNPVRAPVYTRRIGDPEVGMKLTGRVGGDGTLASIYARDAAEVGTGAGRAHVPIVRYKHSLSGDSYVGALYGGRLATGRTNHTGGLDARIRLGQTVLVGMHGLGSRLDQTGGSAVDGHAVAGRVSSSSRRFDWSAEALDISESFDSDIGYLARNGLFRGAGMVRWRLYPSSARVRRIDLQLTQARTHDHPGDLWENFTRLLVSNQLFGSLNVSGWVQLADEVFLGERFDNDGYQVSIGGLLSNKGSFDASFGEQTQPIYDATPYQGRSRSFSATLGVQPSPTLDAEVGFDSVDFFDQATSQKVLDFTLLRLRATVQPNRYLFFRGIMEYDWYREELLTDLLASFTYIPGTVIHLGYGALYERTRWTATGYVPDDDLMAMRRRFFFKTSYLFRA